MRFWIFGLRHTTTRSLLGSLVSVVKASTCIRLGDGTHVSPAPARHVVLKVRIERPKDGTRFFRDAEGTRSVNAATLVVAGRLELAQSAWQDTLR